MVLLHSVSGAAAPVLPPESFALWNSWGGLTKAQQALVEKVHAIAQTVVAANADDYDRRAVFPEKDIQALWRASLLSSTLDEDRGGQGYGIGGRDPLAMYLIIETLARVSPATAHCFQINANTCRLLSALATDSQIARWLKPMYEKGTLFVGSGAEPGGGRQSTIARRVPGGWRVTGKKHYTTNATHAEWMMVLVRAEDLDTDLTLVIPTGAKGVRIDAQFWNPVGMRACVSPMLYLDDVFVPDEDVLGTPGEWFRGKWLAKINLGFTSNYLGTLYGMYDWLVPYLRDRSGRKNPIYQTHIGELKARINAARLTLRHALEVSQTDMEQGLLLSNEAKFMAVDALEAMISIGNQAAGSTALFLDYPYQRLMRDAQVHLLHRRKHVGIQIVGQAALAEPYELNLS